MIVADSSIWIDFFRGRSTWGTELLAGMMEGPRLIVGDLILCEVLRGAESDHQARKLEAVLRRFDVVPMVSPDLAIAAAAKYRVLRSHGITLRKTVDLLIGTFCICEGLRLLHADRDYDAMERHLGLQVLHA